MSTYDLHYISDKHLKEMLTMALQKEPSKFSTVSVKVVDHATILPGKPDPDPSHVTPWGIGGVLNDDMDLVDESCVYRAFGGKYSFEEDDVVELDEEVIHINIIPKHWGHFLVDVVSRLWYLVEHPDDNRTITYCGWNLDDSGISGNYLSVFETLGVKRERLLYIKKPTRVRKAIIPGRSFEYSGRFDDKYYNTIQCVINSIRKEMKDGDNYSEYVYLTRRQLKKAKYYDTGEQEVEKAFKLNGFDIIATEKLQFKDQIELFQKAKIVASLSGTLPHNLIFTSPNTEFIILKRTCAVLPPQVGFNNLFNRKITYIDAYHPSTVKDNVSHGEGPFWIECNNSLAKWFASRGFMFHTAISNNPFVKMRNWIVYNFLMTARKLYAIIKRVRQRI